MLPPQAMVMQVPMGIPPPAPMLMVQQQSQGIMGNQPLPIVGGVPQMVPRSLPPVTTTLPNLKNAMPTESVLPSSVVPSSATIGDATPTEEEGTNVSSPSIQITAPGSASLPSTPVPSSQSLTPFNSMLGLNANRPMLSVPPPVSTAGTPIPYPPPNVGFNFPPPGIRPPGQAHALSLNAQMPWMQKQVGSPFADADSSQSTPSTPVRPVPPPQPGMPLHMFGNRPPFPDPQSSNMNSSSMKDIKGKDKPNDMENLDGRNASHQDKINQEMSKNNTDESSMDMDYSRNDMPPGPCFPGIPDFPRGPMNMQRMRGPHGHMPPGPRFPRGMHMGSPFPMRMGGPRGMGGPGMHGRMDMEFSPHHGPRGPRMPMGLPGPHRNDVMHPGHDGRDWYPRDFEPPPYERERERRFRDDWGRGGREPWGNPGCDEADPRRNARDMDEARRDDHRDPWNRDRGENSRLSKDTNTINEKNDSLSRLKDKTNNKSKSNKNLMDELLKLRSYQRGGSSSSSSSLSFNKSNRTEPSREKPVRKENRDSNSEVEKPPDINLELSEKVSGNEHNTNSRREKDRESRKRSRWGRTLSEEREFQQQKRNEIEMKFQSYEQSHAAQQPALNSAEVAAQNTDSMSDMNPSDSLEENLADLPPQTNDLHVQNEPALPEQNPPDFTEPNDISDQNIIRTLTENADNDHEKNTAYLSTSNTAETQTQITEGTDRNALDSSIHDVNEMTIQKPIVTPEKHTVFNDLNDSTVLNKNIPQTESESLTSTKVTDSGESSVIENTSVCSDSDLIVNSDITNSTSNEITEDADMQNSSLVSTES